MNRASPNLTSVRSASPPPSLGAPVHKRGFPESADAWLEIHNSEFAS
jgi:hypothetical protein